MSRGHILCPNDFAGTFRGAGAPNTVVQNLPDLEVTVVDFVTQAPSADVKWPSIMAFNGGDIGIYDMTIRALGEQPTLGWTIFDLSLTELAHGIIALGPEVHVDVRRV